MAWLRSMLLLEARSQGPPGMTASAQDAVAVPASVYRKVLLSTAAACPQLAWQAGATHSWLA